MSNVNATTPAGKVESKVKAGTWVTFVVSLLAMSGLELGTDLIPALPASLNWAAPILSAAAFAAASFVGGYLKASRPTSLADSTVEAVKAWLKARGLDVVRRGGNV